MEFTSFHYTDPNVDGGKVRYVFAEVDDRWVCTSHPVGKFAPPVRSYLTAAKKMARQMVVVRSRVTLFTLCGNLGCPCRVTTDRPPARKREP